MPVTTLPNAYTLLTITGMGVAPYSARGVKQSLEPLGQASQLRRTINGDLIDLSLAQFRKYKSTITGGDQASPAIAGIWPGQLVTIECVCELGVMEGAMDRPSVTGSERTEDGVTYFRPVLDMVVTGLSIETDEWGSQVSWTLNLEEV